MRDLGFLFDLDGTLINSLPVVELAWGNWARRHGVPEADVLNFIHGKQAITSLRHFMPGQSEEAIQHAYRLLERFEAETIDGVSALPGTRELLTDLNRLQLPWAIVTSGSLPVLITAEQVSRGKPQPDPYLLGAKTLGLRPAECIVVEDAIVGIQSGLAAGYPVIAVNPPPETPQKEAVGIIVDSLRQLAVIREGDYALVRRREVA